MEFITKARAKRETKLAYLGNINSSAKIEKNLKVNNYTYVIYLSPASTSGYNVCKYSTPECRLGCLNSSGRTKVEDFSGKDMIRKARIKKTILFREEQDFFMNWIVAEMKGFQLKAKRDNFFFSVRLNGTSDINWELIKINGQNIFEIFPDVQFYDYTKNPNIVSRKLPKNYHITFSYTGRNLKNCLNLLKQGYNIAVVFADKNLPKTWNNYKVINGDLTDYRPLDGNGVIVGLKYKKLANYELNDKILNSCFVVNTESIVNELQLAM